MEKKMLKIQIRSAQNDGKVWIDLSRNIREASNQDNKHYPGGQLDYVGTAPILQEFLCLQTCLLPPR